MSELASRLRDKRVIVIGDAILDRYLHGAVERISPEAPVPVVRLQRRERRAGGAANVALNVRALGATPILISIVGEDSAGAELRQLLQSAGIGDSGLLAETSRSSTVKTRIVARHQQIARVDEEDDGPIDDRSAERVLEFALDALSGAAAMVVSDYAKGLLDRRVLTPLLAAARRAGVPTVVDPKLRHFELYQPATVITPNQSEAAAAVAREVRNETDALAAARTILSRLDLEAVLVTRGEAGMLLVPRAGEPVSIRAQAREVFDVTGAGDTVAAALGAALAGGLSLGAAAGWANRAAALAVGHLGTAAIGIDELERFSADHSDAE